MSIQYPFFNYFLVSFNFLSLRGLIRCCCFFFLISLVKFLFSLLGRFFDGIACCCIFLFFLATCYQTSSLSAILPCLSFWGSLVFSLFYSLPYIHLSVDIVVFMQYFLGINYLLISCLIRMTFCNYLVMLLSINLWSDSYKGSSNMLNVNAYEHSSCEYQLLRS